MPQENLFKIQQPIRRSLSFPDFAVILGLVALIYAGLHLALNVPETIRGPEISLAPSALPYYAGLSVTRMLAAYCLSLIFTMIYGRMAAYSPPARTVLIPLLDVLQSVPILSFLPVVLLSLTAILPQNFAAELASVVLIFTSQAWNLTFAWYQSLITIPKELREANSIFHFNSWLRFKTLELPYGMISLIWNSVMSWAGGWFFLMAAEAFTVGKRDFRLPGLGSYLQQAAFKSDFTALAWGIAVLVLIIIALDQFVWRPLLAWSDRYKLEMVESENPPSSWFYDLLHSSRIINFLKDKIFKPLAETQDRYLLRISPWNSRMVQRSPTSAFGYNLLVSFVLLAILFGIYRAGLIFVGMPMSEWIMIGTGILATLVRVILALVIALTWTIPVGVAIGTNRRLATILQPVVQITASIPATALFPALIILLANLQGGLNLAAVLLILLGTQWYLLFNIIAGASSIPQDLKFTTSMLRINGWERWRTLILPALFPFIVTGAITASGGAWNASIVAEHISFGGVDKYTTGIGAVIALATSEGNYSLLLAGTTAMILTVIVINRLVWRRLYRLAEDQYRME